MYSKKYCCTKIEELHNKNNPLHDAVIGSECYLAYLNVGERGWFLYNAPDWYGGYAHRVHTSEIKDVEYTDNQIILTTGNTRYVFDLITDGES